MTALAASAASAPANSGRLQPALRADHAGGQHGQDQDRLEPLAEDDDGRVRDHGRVVGRARPDGGLRLAERDVELRARLGDLLRRGMARDQLGEALLSVRAVPEVALDGLEEAGREPAQPLLRPELEEGVALQPGLLGGAVGARLHGQLEPVERGPDHVEVGQARGIAPRGREDALDDLEGVVHLALDLGRIDDRGAVRRGLDLASDLRQRRGDLPRRRRVAGDEHALEVGEGPRRAVAEGDRLLDLEPLRDPAVAHSALVLDGHEREEALHLPGAPDQLLLGERRGPEAQHHIVDRPARGPGGGVVACGGGGDQVAERSREPVGCGGAALLAVGGLEQGEVAARERRRLSAADVEPRLRGGLHVVELRPHEPLIGVEQIGAGAPGGLGSRQRALLECGECRRRVGGCARKARRRPELAHEQPAAGAGDVAAPGRSHGLPGGVGEERCPGLGARDRQPERVARLGCPDAADERGVDRRQRRGGVRCGGEAATHRAARVGYPRGSGCAPVQGELRLGVGEAVPGLSRELPGCRLRGAGDRRRDQQRDADGEQMCGTPHRVAIRRR